ncbi:hypothetical protein SLEP1_g51914 [Rubroshorea leprosula]|uniref:Disease resistance protein At4g27190-like leucine-rich repeats domain-containing protein n=1 Tax=Rubroshorea leprosula TaxID=152421 RepID=A0AAV5M6Y6_9ROSI|nr:hypothetical protein SLEP1_g51914 [Rubroshorea leprosula]
MVKAGMKLTEVPNENEWVRDLKKVLDLSETGIEALFDSISNLVNLSALRLRNCRLLEYLPSLAEHRALKKLDLNGAGIEVVPQGMEMLLPRLCVLGRVEGVAPPPRVFFNLKILSISGCSGMSKLIPLELLQALRNLEQIDVYGCRQMEEIIASSDSDSSLDKFTFLKLRELLLWNLPQLKSICSAKGVMGLFSSKGNYCSYGKAKGNGTDPQPVVIDFIDNNDLLSSTGNFSCQNSKAEENGNRPVIDFIDNNISVKVLNAVALLMGSTYMSGSGAASRSWRLDSNSAHKKDTRHMANFCVLDLSETGIEALFDSISNLVNLSALRLRNCRLLEYLPSLAEHRALKKLDLNGAGIEVVPQGMEMLLPRLCVLGRVEGVAPPPRVFFNLKILSISGCSGMSKLIPLELLQALRNLEQIDVYGCRQMEEIIASSDSDSSLDKFTFLKLRELLLWNLPQLKSICSAKGVMVCDSIEQIEIHKCWELKRIRLLLPALDNDQPSPPPRLTEIEIDDESKSGGN